MILYFAITEKNLLKLAQNHLMTYPTPQTLNYFFNFGSLAGLCLLIQILSGVFLAMHYIAEAGLAFSSIEHIMREVNFGWFLRYLHANGASMFFIVLYIHIARGIFYNSYMTEMTAIWLTGLVIFLLTMGTAFIGYVLPWGQMSFWGATVITNFVSAIPVIGIYIVQWLWGGFAVGASTLTRFFSLHYLLPFIVSLIVIFHIYKLHEVGSSNPFPFDLYQNIIQKVNFAPYYVIKDFLGVMFFILLFSYFIFFAPNYLGHSDNYIEANSLVTPEHIVPEWYFLPFYAILRAIPDKLGGIITMLGSIIIFALLPFLNLVKKNLKFNFIYSWNKISKQIVFLFFGIFILLAWLGACPVEEPYLSLGSDLTMLYFLLIIKMS